MKRFLGFTITLLLDGLMVGIGVFSTVLGLKWIQKDTNIYGE